MGLKARDDEPIGCPSRVDQLLGGKTRPRTQVGEVTLRGARPNAHKLRGVLDRPTGHHEGRKPSIWRCVGFGEGAPRRYLSLILES
jgi:hypothetical protein